MRIPGRILMVSLLMAGAVWQSASAQTSRMHIGPRLSYNFDLEELGIGAQFSIPIATRLEFYPSFDYYFVDPGSAWGLNADLKYRFAGENVRWLYVGAGLNVTGVSDGNDETDAGLNLIAGVESLKGRIHPFGEFRGTIGGASFVQLSAGLNITLGKH
jgi:hypothetical protein